MKASKENSQNEITISVNTTDDCWKKEFTAKCELLESRINGYAFKDMPSSYTEVYKINKVSSKKFQHYLGQKCYKWMDNSGDVNAQQRNNERCATLFNNY